MQHTNVELPNYLPMNLPSGAPPPMAGGGAMGKGGGRPGGAPGMGGKGGGMRPPPGMGTRPNPFRGGPMGPATPAGPPMRPPQSPVLPPPPPPERFIFTPPPPPAPGQPRFYQPGPPGMFDPVPELQPQVPSNLLSTFPALGLGGAQPTSAGGAMSMLNQAMGSPQQISPMGSQELLNAAADQFTVAQSQPPRIMPGGRGRQLAPAPAPQPGLFDMMNALYGAGG